MRIEHWLYTLPLRLRSLFGRRDVEREMDEELRYHVERLVEQHVARGMSADDAHTAALREIGGIERRKEEIRATRQVTLIENVMRDVRHALRMLWRTPGFTVVAAITLAIGIGANTAIFTVVNAALLRPLDYGDAGRLAVLQYREQETVTPGALLHWQEEATKSFERIGAAQSGQPTLTGRGVPEQVRGLRLTADILPLLQVRPLLGRVLLPAEAHSGKDHVVVLSDEFWRRRFGSDPTIVGQTLILDGIAHTVIGVMPDGFQFAPFWSTHAEIFRPLVLDGLANNFDGASLRVFARLRPGITLAQARAEMSDVGARIKRDHPDEDARISVIPLQEKVVGSVTSQLWMLLAAVALVLLIACANVTHLQLMRASSREREMAMRVSLGASRARLLQQSLVESLMLSIAGAMGGLAIAWAGTRLLVALAPPEIPRLDTIQFDPRVFVFMLVITVVAGLLSGAVPALAAAGVDPNRTLKESGRGSSGGRGRLRTGGVLVVSEFAMAVILLVGAGLVLRSVAAMLGVDAGFDPRNVLAMQVAVRGSEHDTLPRRGAFYGDVAEQIAALPGVESVGAINHLPLHGDSWQFTYYIDGRPTPTRNEQPRALFRVIRAGYFQTMRIAIVRGRDIDANDMRTRSHVVVLDESAARRYWPNADPIGQRISVTDPSKGPEWFTVIGVVKNVQQPGWGDEPNGEMYYPYWDAPNSEAATGFASQLHPRYMTFVVRTRGAPLGARDPITRIVSRIDPNALVTDFVTMDQVRGDQVAGPRFYLILLAGFALAALLLAAVGVYGVISHLVASRSREMGIRLALGAAQQAPFHLVVRQGLKLAIGGSVAGVGGALLLTRYLRSLLFEIQPNDPVTFAVVPFVLIAVAVLACYIPARRAAGVDPMVVLRGE